MLMVASCGVYFSFTKFPSKTCKSHRIEPLPSGLSELRIHVASMADSGTYQCSTSHNYDYIKCDTVMYLKISAIIF